MHLEGLEIRCWKFPLGKTELVPWTPVSDFKPLIRSWQVLLWQRRLNKSKWHLTANGSKKIVSSSILLFFSFLFFFCFYLLLLSSPPVPFPKVLSRWSRVQICVSPKLRLHLPPLCKSTYCSNSMGINWFLNKIAPFSRLILTQSSSCFFFSNRKL